VYIKRNDNNEKEKTATKRNKFSFPENQQEKKSLFTDITEKKVHNKLEEDLQLF
jgi:hypothetical protein